MKFSEIVEIIRSSTSVEILSQGNNCNISGLRLWDGDRQSLSDSILYFGYDAQVEEWPQNFILASDQKDLKDLPLKGHPHDLIRVPFASLTTVFNRIQDRLSQGDQGGFRRYILDVARNATDIDALIDTASQSFNASLILIDRDFRILSYSTSIPVIDELWKRNIDKGYCDYEFISEVRKLKSVQSSESTAKAFPVTCTASPYQKLACRIFSKGAWIASLILIEGEHSYTTDHLTMLEELGSVSGDILLKHEPELLLRSSDYHNVLYNLIIGTPIETLPKAFQNYTFPEDMIIMYFKAGNEEDAFVNERDVRESIIHTLPTCHVLSHRKAVIVICRHTDQSRVHDLLRVFPPEYRVKVGISDIFTDIRQLRSSADDAHDALQVGSTLSPDEPVFRFEDHRIDIMLSHLSQTESLRRYCHHAIPLLKRYDDRNKTELLPTLRAYIKSNGSIKETSELLFLHRNSVLYRLHKISDLCELDLDDTDVRFNLRMTFHILRVTG